MENNQKEILLIAQEECAEVTQAISKVFRFGMAHSIGSCIPLITLLCLKHNKTSGYNLLKI